MQRDYLSQKVRGLHPSIIRQFFDIAATMKDIISLGIGEPDFTTPEPIINAGMQALRQGQTHYTSNLGVTKLREAICAHLFKLYGVSYQPDQIIITVGGSEALYLAATALLENGDEVIIPTPCFVSYQPEVALAGGVPVEVPTCMEEGFNLDIPAIEKAVTPRTKAVLVNSPNNPTGAVASRECMLELARIAEEHDLIVISDEIYDRLVYGVEHVCFSALPGMQKRTILVGGFSKDYAMTGWRIGYAAANDKIAEVMSNFLSHSTGNPSSIAQWAAVEALNGPQEDIKEMRAAFEGRRNYLVERMNSIPGVSCLKPEGAFYVMMNLEKLLGKTIQGTTINTAEDFAQAFLEKGLVAVVPCTSFGSPGFVRWSYATSMKNIKEGMDRLERFLAE